MKDAERRFKETKPKTLFDDLPENEEM